ncbi:hypothetical protein PUN4_780002 [Paraburkholderia unamae]|nr:hypothetical protein PUN4_780002 [Paraburkholderia unamae]
MLRFFFVHAVRIAPIFSDPEWLQLSHNVDTFPVSIFPT